MTKDNFFYIIQRGKLKDYRLVFVPGHSDALTWDMWNDSGNWVKLPPNFIQKKLELSSLFENSQPWGLPQTDEFKITWDLHNIFDDGVNNWDNLRAWILSGTADTTATKFNTIWIQEGSYDPDTEIYTVSKTLFIGVQEVKPLKELKVIRKQITFDVTYISLFRYATENTTWSEFPQTITDYDVQIDPYSFKDNYHVPRVIDRQWLNMSFLGYAVDWMLIIYTSGWAGKKNTKVNFIEFSKLFTYMETQFQSKIQAITRLPFTFAFTNDFLTHITKYKQTTKDVDYAVGQPMTFTDNVFGVNDKLYLLWSVWKDEDLIAGLISDNDKNQTLYKWKTPWDFLKAAADAYISKCYMTYADALTIGFEKVYDSHITLSAAQKVINRFEVIGEISIKFGENVIQTSTARCHGVTGNDDKNECSQERGGAVNDKRFESLIPFHNILCNYDESDEEWQAKYWGKEPPTPAYTNFKTLPIITGLYYYDFIEIPLKYALKSDTYSLQERNEANLTDDLPCMILLGDKSKLDISTTTSVESTSDTTRWTNFRFNIDERRLRPVKITSTGNGDCDYLEQLQIYINTHNELVGIPYVTSKAAMDLLGKPNQVIISFKVNSQKCNISHLGCVYTIDIGDLLPYNITTLPQTNTDAILIDCQTDLIKEESTVKFIIPDL